MMTLQIDNREVENFIQQHYHQDTQSLWQDFTAFVKNSLSDSYPAITAEEAKKRVAKAIEEVDSGRAVMLTQEEYDREMKTLQVSIQDDYVDEFDDFISTLPKDAVSVTKSLDEEVRKRVDEYRSGTMKTTPFMEGLDEIRESLTSRL